MCYFNNALKCLISKHEKSMNVKGRSPEKRFIAFDFFDFVFQHLIKGIENNFSVPNEL